MPELPEVETICETLRPKLVGHKIMGGIVKLPKLIQDLSPVDFLAQVTKTQIQRVQRRGKYILIELSEGLTLIFHLRMTGQLIIEAGATEPTKATYLQLWLDHGQELRFRDQRKFGKVWLVSQTSLPSGLQKLGPEPLTDDFTSELFQKQLGKRKLAIKKALLNQEILAGLGNIYTDEALFLAGIHPTRPVNSLTINELEELYHTIRQVLTEGIAHRGTTKRDYLDGEGKAGSYQNYLRVYGRQGELCPKCQQEVVWMNFGGRGTHYCPNCQK